jgi:hypothetical protein
MSSGFESIGALVPVHNEVQGMDTEDGSCLPAQELVPPGKVSRKRKTSGARQGSAHWNASMKKLSEDPFRTSVITPTRPAEIKIMAASLTIARKECQSDQKMCELVTHLLLAIFIQRLWAGMKGLQNCTWKK